MRDFPPAPKAKPKRQHRSRNVFGPPLAPATAPITTAQRVAHRRVERAQQRLPQRPLPAIPTLTHPTRRQAQTAIRLGQRSIQRQVPRNLPPAERARRIVGIQQEVRQDPRERARVAPIVAAQAKLAHDHRVRMGLADIRRNPHVYGVSGDDIAHLHHLAMHGALPDAARTELAKIGRSLEVRGTRAKEGPGDRRVRLPLGVATINADALRRTVMGATSLNRGDLGPRTLVRRSLADLGLLGTAPFVGGYQVTRAGVAAARGDTQPATDLAKGVGHALAESAPAQLLRGHPAAAGKAFSEHPLLESLNFLGLEGVAGRAAGALARGVGSEVSEAGLRGALARAGSTARSPLALTDQPASRLLAERKGSRDLIRKALQSSADRRRPALLDAEGRVVTAEVGGRTLPVLQSRTAEFPIRSERQRGQEGRADYVASRANSANRLVRDQTGREVDKTLGRRKLGRHHRLDAEMVDKALEGTIRTPATALEDLRAHRARLDAAYERAQGELAQMRPKGVTRQTVFRHKVEMAANRDRAKLIDRFLASKPTEQRLERIFNARGTLGTALNTGDVEIAQAGIGNLHRMSRARLFPYAQEHMGARHFADETGAAALRHPDGRFMSNAEIEAHMRASGVDPTHIAYLPHRADVVGRRAYYSQFRGGSRPAIPNQAREGRLYERGATGTSAATIRDQAVRQQTTLTKARQIDKFIHESAMVGENGKAFTSKEARELADRLRQDTGESWTPVSMAPAKLEAEVQRAVQQGQDPRAMEGLSERLINSRIEAAKAEGVRNVGLVPSRMMDRLAEHAKPAGGPQRVLELINRPFRFTVLAQPRWIAGNFIEPFFVRLPTVGSGAFLPGLAMDLRAAHRLLKGADPKLAEELQSELLGGLFIGQRGASNRRTIEDLPGVARFAAVTAKLPVVRQFAWLTRKAVTLIGHGFFAGNRVMERQFQKAALGNIARKEVQGFLGSWVKAAHMGEEAVAELRRGLTNTATQQRFANEMDVLLGKYSRWSPAMRHAVQGPTPFIPWSLAAARFVFWTMPVHNSVKTAALVAASKVNHQTWEDAHADVPPGGLNVALPTKRGGFVDISRYTPYGFSAPIAGGDFSGVTDPLLPQVSGVVAATQGKDPFGRDLTAPKTAANSTGRPTQDQKAGIIVNTLLEAVVPQLAMLRRLREGGGTPYSTSTVLHPRTKPGTSHMSAVRRTLDPFRPIYLRAPAAQGGGGHVKGNYWQRLAGASHAQAQRQAADDNYWRSLAAGH